MNRHVVSTFEQLGTRVDEKWREHRYDEDCFTDIAEASLRCFRPPRDAMLGEFLEEVIRCDRLPQQLDPESEFGEPPLTIYRTDRFVIDVNYWLDASTTIHDHGFSGAFAVARGSSIHVEYDFEAESRYSEHLKFGSLKRRRLELLVEGDVRPIHAGAATIHRIFHLERPSVSVVVRTLRQHVGGPQMNYILPGIAYNPNSRLEASARSLDLVLMAYRAGLESRGLLATRFLQQTDASSALGLVLRSRSELANEEFAELLTKVEEHQPVLAAHLVRAMAEFVRQGDVLARRKDVVSCEHRLLLAILLNAECRTDVLALLQAARPRREPTAMLMESLQELLAIPSSVPGEPNALGVSMDECARAVFGCAVRGLAPGAAVRKLSEQFDGVDDHADVVADLYRLWSLSPVLGPLFR